LARSPATNFLAARIGTFASFMALCENQASTTALQRFQTGTPPTAVKTLGAHRNPDCGKSRECGSDSTKAGAEALDWHEVKQNVPEQ
jgi:hypothetical protein